MNLTDGYRERASYSNSSSSIVGKTSERQNRIFNVINGIVSNINQGEMPDGGSLRVEVGPGSFFISRLNNSAKGLKNKVEVILNEKCRGGVLAFHGEAQSESEAPGILRRDVEVHSFQNTTELKSILPGLIERKIIGVSEQRWTQTQDDAPVVGI